MKKTFRASDFILLALTLLLSLGTAFLFHPCSHTKPDGTWMMCHYAAIIIIALGTVMSVLSLVRVFIADNKIKAGVSLSFIPLSILTFLVPKILIPLCGNLEMRCHTIMRPAVCINAAVILICAVLDFIQLVRQK